MEIRVCHMGLHQQPSKNLMRPASPRFQAMASRPSLALRMLLETGCRPMQHFVGRVHALVSRLTSVVSTSHRARASRNQPNSHLDRAAIS